LATTYGIIKQAGGDIEIYSEIGLGTAFSVLLPATSAAAPRAEDPVAPGHSRGGETILVVEDELAMRELTRRILAANGYEVLVAQSGADAVELVRSHPRPIHLLVTDVVMPQMLGQEVAEGVHVTRPGMRVLYMSGYARPALASQGTLDPGVSLVEKPFSPSQLLAKVREVLDADER
jgi:DNA-binding NtrC family response regulator